MKYKVYVTMEFSKEIEANSKEEAYMIAQDIDFDWRDCCDQEISELWEVD